MDWHLREMWARYANDLVKRLRRKENTPPPEPSFGESSDYRRTYIRLWPERKTKD